jgi:hypothetical protein
MNAFENDIAEIKALTDKDTIVTKFKLLFVNHLLNNNDEMSNAKQVYLLLVASDESISKLAEDETVVIHKQISSFFKRYIDLRYGAKLLNSNFDECLRVFLMLLQNHSSISSTLNTMRKCGIRFDVLNNLFLQHLYGSVCDHENGLWQYVDDDNEHIKAITRCVAVRSIGSSWSNKFIFKDDSHKLEYIYTAFDYGNARLTEVMDFNTLDMLKFQIQYISKIKSELNVMKTDPIEHAKNTLGKLSSEEKTKFLVQFVKTF